MVEDNPLSGGSGGGGGGDSDSGTSSSDDPLRGPGGGTVDPGDGGASDPSPDPTPTPDPPDAGGGGTSDPSPGPSPSPSESTSATPTGPDPSDGIRGSELRGPGGQEIGYYSSGAYQPLRDAADSAASGPGTGGDEFQETGVNGGSALPPSVDPGRDPQETAEWATAGTSEGIIQQLAGSSDNLSADDISVVERSSGIGIEVDRPGIGSQFISADELRSNVASSSGVGADDLYVRETNGGFEFEGLTSELLNTEISEYADQTGLSEDQVSVIETEEGYRFAPSEDVQREITRDQIELGREGAAAQAGLESSDIQVVEREGGGVGYQPTEEAQAGIIRQQVASDAEGISPGDVSVTPTESGYEIEVAERDFQEEVRYGTTQSESLFGSGERDAALVDAADEGSIGGQLFTGGRGLEVLGQRGSEWLDEHTPEFDVGPSIGTGGESLGTQARNVFVGTPSGAGFAAGLGPRALGSGIAQAEDALGTTDIDEDAFVSGSETVEGLTRAGGQTVEGIAAEPFGALLEVTAPFAISRGASGVSSATRAAGTRTGSRIEAGDPGPGSRGQADLTGPETDAPSQTPEIDPTPTSPDFDPRPGPGQRRPGRLQDQGATRIRGGGPRSPTAGGVSRGFIEQPSRAGMQIDAPSTITDATTATTQGALTRMQAAAAPSWLVASESLIGEEDISTLSDAEQMLGQTLDQRTDQDVTQTELGDLATAPSISQDVGTDGVVDQTTDQTTATTTRTSQETGTQSRQRDEVTASPFPGFQTPDVTLRTQVPSSPSPDPDPSRGRRRPRIPGIDGSPGGLSGPDLEFSDVSTPSTAAGDGLQFGWVSESVTDIGTLGMELPESPSESRLRDISGGMAVASDLPTAQLLDEEEDTADVADALSGGLGVDVLGDIDDTEDDGGWLL